MNPAPGSIYFPPMPRDIFIAYTLSEKEARNANNVIQSLVLQIGSKRLLYDLDTCKNGVYLLTISKIPLYPGLGGRVYFAESLQDCKALALKFLKINFKI